MEDTLKKCTCTYNRCENDNCQNCTCENCSCEKSTSEICNAYHKDLQKFIISKVKNSPIADDLLQDTFIKIHAKLSTLRDESKLKSWIFSIARYSMMDYFRQNNQTIELEEFLELSGEEDENLPKHSTHDCLRGIIFNLPKKYRNPLFLCDIKGIKQTEIAEQLNLTLTTVKFQIQRARKQII